MSARLFFNRDHLSFFATSGLDQNNVLKTKPIGFESGL